RFSTQAGLSFKGEAPDGEVEDYAVSLEAVSDLGLVLLKQADPVAVGANEVYTIIVSNAGPATATGVSVLDPLPPGLTFVSATSSRGGCAPSAGTVLCALGALDAGASATVLLTVIPGLEGTLTNRATTAANEADLDPSNNVAVATVTVLVPPQITSQPQGLAVTNGAAATFSVGALGTNLRYQWRKDGTALTGATNAVLTITNVQPA